MIKGLISISSDDLKKSDKRALSTMYLYWLENGKKDVFDLPLFIDDNGKGVMSVEAFKRVFFAFCVKCGVAYDCNIKSGDDGDESSYNVVRISKNFTNLDTPEFVASFEEPKKADVKRESSKKTAEKSAEKKAKAEAEKVKAEAEADADWNKKASMAIADHLIGKYKLTADRLTLEKEIQNILNKIKA